MHAKPQLLLCLLATLALSACAQRGAVEITPSLTLRPYDTSTPTATLTAAPSPRGTEQSLLPTPTPFVHVVQEGETLLEIALTYGVSLDDLLAGNAGIDPRFLSIGQQLRIPGPDGQPADTLLPTSTPIPLQVVGESCYPSANGGLWCVLTLYNDTDQAVEGLSAQLRLIGETGDVISRDLAFAPINLMAPGKHMPLVHYRPPPAPALATPQFSLISAIGSVASSERYAEAELTDLTVGALSRPGHWEVQAQLRAQGQEDAGEQRAAVLALGLDRAGEVVAFAKWEAEGESGPPWDIKLELFSLGPPIEEIELSPEVAQRTTSQP